MWRVKVAGGSEMALGISVNDQGEILEAQLFGIGPWPLLRLLQEWRPRLRGNLKDLPLPQGNSGPELMLRELLLKARREWQEPYASEELCHCRAVPTIVVQQAIVQGAHSPEKVSRWTNASTACGTCRRDVIALLAHRLK